MNYVVPAGLDFSPALIEHVFEAGSGTVDRELVIQVIDDDVMEREEVFWVHLNFSVSDPLDDDDLVVGQQSLLVRIRPDGADGKQRALCNYNYEIRYKYCFVWKNKYRDLHGNNGISHITIHLLTSLANLREENTNQCNMPYKSSLPVYCACILTYLILSADRICTYIEI